MRSRNSTVLTDTYGAQFGGTGAAVNTVSKSGTNNLHGSAYEFLRNSALDTYNYFDIPGQKPSFKRNQFGGTLGGPIEKDKLFFFINYEGLRSAQGQTERAEVPTTLPDLFEANGMVARRFRWELDGPAFGRDACGDAGDLGYLSACPNRVTMPQYKQRHS